jgi:acyl carrier protein
VNTQEIQTALAHIAETELGLDSGLDAGDLANQLDSVGRLTLVVAIEDHFKICFEPEDEEEIRTLDHLVQLIRRKLGEP